MRPSAATNAGVPIIADGGIRYSGDITKAIAAGANCVMIGGLFAGTAESPGQQILYQGRTFKVYRGMGSLGAMVKGSSERYRQGEQRGAEQAGAGRGRRTRPLQRTAEHVCVSAGRRPESRHGLLGHAEHRGAAQREAQFIQVSHASVRESHPHDIAITQEAPNYTAEFTGRNSTRGTLGRPGPECSEARSIRTPTDKIVTIIPWWPSGPPQCRLLADCRAGVADRGFDICQRCR